MVWPDASTPGAAAGVGPGIDDPAELRRVREALAAIPGSAVILQALFALAPVGFQIYDASGHSLLTNQAFRDIFGSEPPPEYNVLEDEIAASTGILGLIRRAFAGEVISTPPTWYDPRELRQVKVTEGRRVAITTTIFPMRDLAGTVTHVGLVIKDVTAEVEKIEVEERARIEAEWIAKSGALLASSLDYEVTLQSLARLAIPHLADWCVIDIVEGTGEIRRVAMAHVDPGEESVLAEICRLFPPQRADSSWPSARAIRAREPQMLAEIDDRIIADAARSEQHRAMMMRLAPRSYLAVPMLVRERVIGAIGLTYGARSGRRHGPRELRLAGELAGRAALAVDNARLYTEARQAIQVREDFLSMAGHELKTPLTALQLNIQMLSRTIERAPGWAGPGGDAFTKRVSDVKRQATRLVGLVEQLLDVSRLAAGRLGLDLTQVDLAALAREAVGRIEDEAARAGTAISVVAPAPVVGRWDPTCLDQVVGNLLSNALKYGGGAPVEVAVRADGAEATLAVRDHGIGIPPEHHHRIFDRFERAVSHTSFGGLGLGLWICRQLLAAMGGEIDVASAAGEGATFTVRLPR
jgi:signal transduction histidine kinase